MGLAAGISRPSRSRDNNLPKSHAACKEFCFCHTGQCPDMVTPLPQGNHSGRALLGFAVPVLLPLTQRFSC
jgi:hypothetical protein